MGAIYLYDWYSRYALSHLYEGIICGIEKSIIPIFIGIWRETQRVRERPMRLRARAWVRFDWQNDWGRVAFRRLGQRYHTSRV